MYKRIGKKNTGFTVLYSVLVASLVLIIGISIFNIAFKELVLTSQIRNSQFAFYSADAATECVLYWDRVGFSTSPFGEFSGLITEDLDGYWKFDEPIGATEANDSSGNNYTGTLTNMDPINDWVSGSVGGALDFDGDNDGVDIGSPAGLDNISQITITAWVNPRTVGEQNQGRIISNSLDNYGSNWTLGLCSADAANCTGDQIIFAHDWSDGAGLGAWTVPIPSFSWQHISVSYDNSNRGNDPKIYINGLEITGAQKIEQSQPIGNAVVDDNLGVCIGNSIASLTKGCSGARTFNGAIDDVRIYTRILSDQEIADIAASSEEGFTPPINPDTTELECAGDDINSSDPNEWSVVLDDALNPTQSTTTFTIFYEDNFCSIVSVGKANGSTTIDSRGYNTCNENDPNRVERGLRARY